MDVTKSMKKGRGRGSGRGRGDGRGRGRGRGRGSIFGSKAIPVIDLDEDDDLCNMALAQAELENNSIAKSFEVLNAADELEGFDPMAGGMWIYPTNRAVRDYQFEIVKTALFNNTLVSLPTGLGKTFISAVVMYNFQRWYPTGIIVFMAPTRPLVTQQLDACHNTVGISPSKTVELTGQIAPKRREHLWKTKTVFFLTPQVMISDLERNFFPPEKVRCIVVDEAHKALGNHAYVQVIAKISEKNRLFRVLALSATPGSDIIAVQQVFKNLLISRVELRSENSLDILPYIHDKKVETVVVKLDDYLKSVHDQLLEVFQTYSGKLMKAGALSGRDGTSYSKFQLLKSRETFRKEMGHKMPTYQKGYIEGDYNICITLAHSIEILLSHGLRTFYIFLHGVFNKEKGSAAVTAELRKSVSLQNVLEDIQQKLNISVENSTFDFDLSNTSGIFSVVGSPKGKPNRSYIQEDVDYTLSHPKLKILKDIVQKHFLEYSAKNATTRVMIFSQFRDSVQEIGNMLNSLRPMVKPMVFIGQANTSSVGRGLKQKDQVQVVQQFRDGGFNVLVSTSVGEEGLDIGEVDLIICFDASKSPTRLIQRMGRTGRQREGRTVFLLTYGKEERSYQSSFSLHSSISKTITDPNKLQPFLYKQSPRMVPVGIEPTCYKMSIILSTELSSQPEPMQVDIDDDDDEDAVPQKEVALKNVKKKQTNVGKKKKNETAGTSSKKTNSEKKTSQNIVKLFERMKEGAIENTSKQHQSSGNAPRKDSPIVFGHHDDGYGMEDGLLMFAADNVKAFDDFSVYPKMFDINSQDRLEWKPCTTFVKNKLPPSNAISISSAISKLDFLVLDENELSAVEYSIKARESFAYLKEDYCNCGNTIEPHEASRDDTCYNTDNTPLNAVILDEPFIDEEFEDDLPLELFEDFMDPTPPEVSERNAVQTPPPQEAAAHIFHRTPVKEASSDEDIKSEFSASPEICTNRFLEKLNEIKAAKATTSVTPPASNIQNPLQLSAGDDELEMTSSLNVSKKKFKFKKKAIIEHIPRHEEHEENGNMSPSPPLSPILNLPIVTNDLFKVPNSLLVSPGAAKVTADNRPRCDNNYSLKGIYPSEFNVTDAVSPSTMNRKPVKFLKPMASNQRLEDVVSDPIEEPRREIFQNSPPSSIFKNSHSRSWQHTAAKSVEEEHFKSTFPKVSSIPATAQSRKRPSLKIVKPDAWKYSCSDETLCEPQPERRPIVRTSPTIDQSFTAFLVDDVSSTETGEPSKKFDYASVKDKFKFKKCPSVTSEVPSTTSYNSRPPTGRNLLSRNRVKKPVTTTVSTLSTNPSSKDLLSTSTAKVISAPLTPPQPCWDPTLSDDSPEVVVTKEKTLSSHCGRNEADTMRISSNYHEQTIATTPVSHSKSTSNRRFRIPDAVSVSRSVTRSPVTPLRYSFSCQPPDASRRSPTYSCSPVRATSLPLESGGDSPFVIERQNLAKRKRRRANANPFIEAEAEVTDDSDETTFGDENEFEFDGLDDMDDSFVTHDDQDTGVTDSQQVMYLESVKDAIPVRFGRIEKPLSPKYYGNDMDITGETYEDDSFCQQDDDVEYMDVGVFTQAMNQARIDLAQPSNSGRQTRRGKREAMASKNAVSYQPKQRRRIVTLDDSSDDDDD